MAVAMVIGNTPTISPSSVRARFDHRRGNRKSSSRRPAGELHRAVADLSGI